MKQAARRKKQKTFLPASGSPPTTCPAANGGTKGSHSANTADLAGRFEGVLWILKRTIYAQPAATKLMLRHVLTYTTDQQIRDLHKELHEGATLLTLLLLYSRRKYRGLHKIYCTVHKHLLECYRTGYKRKQR